FADAPQTVAHFIRLARSGALEGRPFRVPSPRLGFLIAGAGGGVPVQEGKEGQEPHPAPEVSPAPFLRGSLGQIPGSGGPGGLEFFIAYLPAPELDARAILFAQVTEGMEVVDGIADGDLIEKVDVEGFP